MNAHVPALVAEAFAGSRIVAYSTGCVYPYVNVLHGGATEFDAGNAAGGRLCQFLRRTRGHVPVFLAHARNARTHHPPELRDRHALRRAARRGVTRCSRRADRSHDRPRQRDLAGRRQRDSPARARPLHGAVEPAQCQRPGNHQRALARANASRSAWPSGRSSPAPRRPRAGSSIRAEATRLFGYPSVPLIKLVDWTADWIARGLPSLGKDTHFDTRDGKF